MASKGVKRKISHLTKECDWEPIMIQRLKNIPKTKGNWDILEGMRHLERADSRFSPLFLKHDIPKVYFPCDKPTTDHELQAIKNWSESPFKILLRTIVFQQLSITAAESVWQKFIDCFPNALGRELSPLDILECEVSQMTNEQGKRKTLINGSISGLSIAKAKYIKSLAEHFLDESKLKNVDFFSLDDTQLFEKLIAVNGLGAWSVHIFMIFALHRPNVLPIGDLGFRRGLCAFYGHPDKYFEGKSKISLIETNCSSWAPYSSLASFYIWKLAEKSNN